MSDSVIFYCWIAVMFVYFSFILYQWLSDKRNRDAKRKLLKKKVDYRFNIVLPAASKIFCAVNKRFDFELKEEVLSRYRKLYVGKNDENIKRDYWIKHISIFLYMMSLFLVIVFGTIVVCQNNRDLFAEYYIEKNDIGEGQKDITLKTDIAGINRDIDISVPDRKYSQSEIKTQIKKVKRYIYKYYLGKNKSSDSVRTNLKLITKVQDSMISISWISDDEDIISNDGTVHSSKLEKPQTTQLTAVLKYNSFKEKLKFNITVLPVKKDEKESIWSEWKRKFEDTVANTEELKYLKLPDKVKGKKVRYSIKKYELLWKNVLFMLSMFCIVPMAVESVSKSKVAEREKQLKLAYPEMIEKFILLLNAGLPVKSAWMRIAQTSDKNIKSNDYLIEEMLLTKRQMDNGLSEQKAYEMFGRRIGLLPYMKFCTLLVQNLKKGSSDMIRILEYESSDMFNERKENAKILGEEASTKLLVPMMIMMIIIFAIILYAAFSSM